jgi:hypothetical protein
MRTPSNSPGHAVQEAPARCNSYSAHVRLYLILADGERLPLASTCDAWVDLREPRVLSPGRAVLEIRVEDDVERWNVELAPSAEPSRRVRIRAS